MWRVSDVTCVATSAGVAYVAFVVDAFARRIAGRVPTSLRTNFVSDALEQVIHARTDIPLDGLVRHSDRGSQYVSMLCIDRPPRRGHRAVGGSRDDAYDNALAESVMPLFKTELIRPQGPWRSLHVVEFATLAWVDWFNTRRLP